MLPHRSRHAIYCPSCGPPFGLFPRHRRYSQRENGTTPYTRECILVSSLGTPNLHKVATPWHYAAELAGAYGQGSLKLIVPDVADARIPEDPNPTSVELAGLPPCTFLVRVLLILRLLAPAESESGQPALTSCLSRSVSNAGTCPRASLS